MSDKGDAEVNASRLLGSTLFHGWYESAIFCQRDTNGFFRFKTDHLREMGEENEFALQGLGVGRFFFSSTAQGATDSLGRKAPRTISRDTNVALLKELQTETPGLKIRDYAELLGVSPDTIKRYRRVIKRENTPIHLRDE
jgi:hypothetical protein